MTEIDLDGYGLKELKDLRTKVDRAISSYEDRQKLKAREEVEAFARDRGFSLDELAALQPVKKRKPADPKYANPADPSDTWSGRGRRPRWVEEALASGKELADLAI
ncbi:H-NS histone family protein [Frigidibacter sp. MR17.14]|uniref:H-NS histone family protein n=1 Tax=Frigidibacter sp. MR17.14 TaxID=3126509 RepID=UPI003012E46D